MGARHIVLAIAFVAPAALAQGNEGFFRPLPNGDMTLTPPRVEQPEQAAPASPGAVAEPQARAPDPAVGIRAAEEQLDRAQRETDRERERMLEAPAPVTGAFTGSTSERDR
jgi:hypothetical protein